MKKIKFQYLKLISLIGFFAFSILLFRGRLGSDDLETFNAAYNFYINRSYLELKQTFAWSNRTLWVILDICIIFFADKLVESNYLFAVSQFICGYLMTFSAFLGFYLIYQFLRKSETYSNSMCAIGIFIFCSPILILATGDGIESLIFLLIVYMYTSLANSNILAYSLYMIKFYFAPLIITIEYFKNNYKNIYLYTLLFIIIFVLKNLIIEENDNSYLSRIVNFNQYLENIYNIFISVGAGFIFIWPIFIICIYFGYGRYTTIKIFNVLTLLLFLSLFSFWHGQGPGTRYIIPVMAIFISEIAVAVKKIKYLKIVFLMYAILNISTLDYRNTSVFEYRNDSASHGRAYGVDDRNIHFYEFNQLEFNPIIFSSQIFIYKIFNYDCNKIYVSTDCKNIYPRTLISRVSYSLNRDLSYTSFIRNKILISGVHFLYFFVYCFIYFIAFYLFIVSFISNKLKINFYHNK